MKTFEEIAEECAKNASESWKSWTQFLYGLRITAVFLLLGGIGMQFVTYGWAGGIVLMLGSVGAFLFSKVIIRDRKYFWDLHMKNRQDCLDDAKRFR